MVGLSRLFDARSGGRIALRILTAVLLTGSVLHVATVPALAQGWEGAAAVALRVTDEDGQPIADAQVVARISDADDLGPPPVATDTGGRAVVSGLRDGEWFIEVSHPGYMLFAAYVNLRADKKPVVGFSSQVNTATSWSPMTVKFQKASADFRRSAPQPAEPKPPTVVRQTPPPPPRQPDTVVRPEPEPPKVVRPEAKAEEEPEASPAEEPEVKPTEVPEAQSTTEPEPVAGMPEDVEAPVAEPEPAVSEARIPAPEPEPAVEQSEPVPFTPEPVPTVETQGEPSPEASQPSARSVEPEAAEPARTPPAPATPVVAERGPAEVMPASPEPVVPEPVESEPVESEPVEPELVEPIEPAPVGPEMLTPESTEPEPVEPEPVDLAPAQPDPEQPLPEEVKPTDTPAIEPVVSSTAPEEPMIERPAPEPVAPAPERSITPAEPESAAPAPATASRLPRFLRSAAAGTCSECQPGEWAVAAEQESARAGDTPATSACTDEYLATARRAAQQLADAPGERLEGYAGPMLTAMFRLADGAGRDEIQEQLGTVTDPESNCQMAGIVLPEGTTFSGYTLEAWDNLGGRGCRAGMTCAVGRARWLDEPEVVVGTERSVVYSIFKNRSTRRPRRLRMTIYFTPDSEDWAPRTR